MEQTLSKEIQERLDKIDWNSLKEQYGISKDSIYSKPRIAEQLAYGQMTDLVHAQKENFSGDLSLRAFPSSDSDKWTAKVFTIERQKNADNLTLYNQPITSEKVKEALLERGDWLGQDGQKCVGYLNANGGRPISIVLDGVKQQFLVSIHQQTNRVVGIPVDQARSYFFDKDNNLRGRGMYGVQFTAEQANALAEGKAVVISSQRKDGQAFQCCVQFDAAMRQPVICHPSWFKEAQRAGMGEAPKQKLEEKAAQEQKASQEQGSKKSSGMKR
jgi:hypothetical protein